MSVDQLLILIHPQSPHSSVQDNPFGSPRHTLHVYCSCSGPVNPAAWLVLYHYLHSTGISLLSLRTPCGWYATKLQQTSAHSYRAFIAVNTLSSFSGQQSCFCCSLFQVRVRKCNCYLSLAPFPQGTSVYVIFISYPFAAHKLLLWF